MICSVAVRGRQPGILLLFVVCLDGGQRSIGDGGTAMQFDREFLTSKAWRMKRLKILRRDGYQCQISKRYGRNVEGNVVHHIFPRSEFPEYQLCDWNLITVSLPMHKKLESEDGLTQEGIDLLRKTARANGIPIPPRYG